MLHLQHIISDAGQEEALIAGAADQHYSRRNQPEATFRASLVQMENFHVTLVITQHW